MNRNTVEVPFLEALFYPNKISMLLKETRQLICSFLQAELLISLII